MFQRLCPEDRKERDWRRERHAYPAKTRKMLGETSVGACAGRTLQSRWLWKEQLPLDPKGGSESQKE